jgi:2-hydroxy-3-keto-5-methylthiopentenyl-1-phosphate phosphatase
MDSVLRTPVLFFDFDNTITQGDVLDRVIERYSASDSWREWEAQWQAGTMTTRECLQRQMGNLRVTREELLRFMNDVAIDPGFAPIVAWAARHGIELSILSDNFAPLIAEILRHHGLETVPVFANALAFEGERTEAHFPWHDPACPRCAHCKAQHLRARAGATRIFVGDGLSDVCGALAADVVFAKDSLAAELAKRGVAFHAYEDLGRVLRHLEVHHGHASVA